MSNPPWRQLALLVPLPTFADGGRGRRWTAGENATLRRLVGQVNAASIGARLGRSAGAVHGRCRRLGLRWYESSPGEGRPGYLVTDLAGMLGISRDVVLGWIGRGLLDAQPSQLRVGGGRTVWRIGPEAVEDFLQEHRDRYDPTRIKDQLWMRYVAGLPRARPRDWVTTSVAAKLLHHKPRGIRKLIERGDLPARWRAGAWQIPLVAIREFRPPPLSNGTISSSLRERRAAIRAATESA